MKATNTLSNLLPIFNQDEGEYLNLFGDKTKDYPVLDGNIKINDFDNGSISNAIEYIIQLSFFYLDQMDLNKAVSDNLDFLGNNFYGIKRLVSESESDDDYKNRIKKWIMDLKCTVISIKEACLEFGSNVKLLEGISDQCFCSMTYCGNYTEFKNNEIIYVTPAILEKLNGNNNFFKIVIAGLQSKNYNKIIKILNRYKSAGVNYIIEMTDVISADVSFIDTCFIECDNKFETVPRVTRGFIGGF